MKQGQKPWTHLPWNPTSVWFYHTNIPRCHWINIPIFMQLTGPLSTTWLNLEWNRRRSEPGQLWYHLTWIWTYTSHGPRLACTCTFFLSGFYYQYTRLREFFRSWCMQCSKYLRVNHYEVDPDVYHTPYGLSTLWISWESICCIPYYYLGSSLLIYYADGLPHSLGAPPPSRPFSLTQQLLAVPNLIPHTPCEFLRSLLLLLLLFMILPIYNGVEFC